MVRTGALLVDVIVKLASEISKKILSAASTLMRPCVVATFAVFGIVTIAVPMLGTELARIIGKVFPPSVDSEIFTFAQLIGGRTVFATDQVTVWVLPPAMVPPLF